MTTIARTPQGYVWLLCLLCSAIAGCKSSDQKSPPQSSSVSHWLMCKTVDDCSNAEDAAACVGGFCVDSAGDRIAQETATDAQPMDEAMAPEDAQNSNAIEPETQPNVATDSPDPSEPEAVTDDASVSTADGRDGGNGNRAPAEGDSSDAGRAMSIDSTGDGSDSGSPAAIDAGPIACDFSAFKECSSDSECIIVRHRVDACGTEVWLSVGNTFNADFDAEEARCGATLGAAPCPALETVTEDGMLATLLTTAARCEAGRCESYTAELADAEIDARCQGCADSGFDYPTCVYQQGGPGLVEYTCAEQGPFTEPGVCASVTGQGTCQFESFQDLMMCVCDNGLE